MLSLNTMPETSIVIRTFNEEKHIGNLLRAIEEQSYRNYEIILVDSGSTDKTLSIAETFKVKIVTIESRDFTFGYSLNVGCKASMGTYIVCVSAHVIRTDTEWLTNLIAPFQDEKVGMVYGRQMGNEQSKFSEKMDFRRLFKTESIHSTVPLHYANNANSAIRKALWEKKHFDEYLFGLEDIDWARHVAHDGYLIHYEPKAVIYHIHEERWSQVFNRYRREAIAAVRIGLQEPPQVKMGFFWLIVRTMYDLLYTFPNYTDRRIEEIFRFRYYQWKGSRIGWSQGNSMTLESSRDEMFYPIENESVVIKGAGDAELMEIALPDMMPGDVLIKVAYVGICRTDLEVYEGTLGYYRDGHAKYPIVPGHEFSGTIVRIGSHNKFQERFRVGQRVVGECILSRGAVAKRREVGVINTNGAYSKYIVVPGDSIHKIPEGLDMQTAVLTEPLAVVLRALRRVTSRLTKESIVAVIGAGQIGNLCTQVLAHHGHRVIVYDRSTERLSLLQDIAERTETGIQKLHEADLIIEATGSQEILEVVLRDSHVDSTILLLGFPYGNMQYNFEDFVGQEKVIVGSVGADGVDFENALSLLPTLKTTYFTEIIMPLVDFAKAWELNKSAQQLKIILRP